MSRPPEDVQRRMGLEAPDPDKHGMTRALADTITAEDHFAQDAGGKLWHYGDGAYRQHGERTVRVKVKKLLEEWEASKNWSSHRANEVVEYICTGSPDLWDRPPENQVNVLNGILDLDTGDLTEHTPIFRSPVQIPVSFDPKARCPAWERFVEQVFPEDARELAWEIPAWLMTPDTSIQKAILLLGEGANGKSTYLSAVMAFLGKKVVSNASLQRLEGNRFSVSRLIGKLANICPDLPSDHLSSTSTFKALTGGDEIEAEYKYREPFNIRPYARLVFSANHPPRSGDATHAFYRRWLVVPFDRTFEESEQRPRAELDAELSDPREQSGVLNMAVEAWRRVKSEGFSESESTRRALEEFRDTTDPLSVWLEKNTVDKPDAVASKNELRSLY